MFVNLPPSGGGGSGEDTLLRGKYVRTTRFEIINSGTSGTVTLPASSEVVLDDFGGTVDAVISQVESSKPLLTPATEAGGDVIATTFDASGNWVLSGTPSSYPVAILYRVRQTAENFDSTASNIFGVPTVQQEQQKNNPLFERRGSHFLVFDLGSFTSANIGAGAAGAATASNNQAVGAIQSRTGTTSTGWAGYGSGTVGMVPTLAAYALEGRHALATLSNGTETYTAIIGFGSHFADGLQGTRALFFRYTHSVNGGRWQAVARRSNADTQVIDTGVTADTSFHLFEISLNKACNEVVFKIDGTVVGTMTSTANIPQLTSETLGAGAAIIKSAGTTSRVLWSDLFYYQIDLN